MVESEINKRKEALECKKTCLQNFMVLHNDCDESLLSKIRQIEYYEQFLNIMEQQYEQGMAEEHAMRLIEWYDNKK